MTVSTDLLLTWHCIRQTWNRRKHIQLSNMRRKQILNFHFCLTTVSIANEMMWLNGFKRNFTKLTKQECVANTGN